MKCFCGGPLLAGLLVLLGNSNRARADFIPWGFASSPGPTIIRTDPNSTGGVALTKMFFKQRMGAADIVLTTLTPFSAANAGNPDHIVKGTYKLTLVLRDDGSGAASKLTFSGVINGTLTSAGENLSNTFTSPRTLQVHLGHFWYTVTLGPYRGPTAAQVGTISAHVNVQHNPEPPSLVLAGLGLVGLGLVGWSRRHGSGPKSPPP